MKVVGKRNIGMNVINLRARRAMGMKERYWYEGCWYKRNFGMNVVNLRAKLWYERLWYGRESVI